MLLCGCPCLVPSCPFPFGCFRLLNLPALNELGRGPSSSALSRQCRLRPAVVGVCCLLCIGLPACWLWVKLYLHGRCVQNWLGMYVHPRSLWNRCGVLLPGVNLYPSSSSLSSPSSVFCCPVRVRLCPRLGRFFFPGFQPNLRLARVCLVGLFLQFLVCCVAYRSGLPFLSYLSFGPVLRAAQLPFGPLGNHELTHTIQRLQHHQSVMVAKHKLIRTQPTNLIKDCNRRDLG